MNKNVKLAIGGLFTMGLGLVIGQIIGFKKADKSLIDISNDEVNRGYKYSKTINGVTYLISVIKKSDV